MHARAEGARGWVPNVSREYYCGASRLAERVGKRGIYQQVGVYVATNCRVNIHIRFGLTPPLALFLLRPDDVAKFLISTPAILPRSKLIASSPLRTYRVSRFRDFPRSHVLCLASVGEAAELHPPDMIFDSFAIYKCIYMGIIYIDRPKRPNYATRNYICLSVNT